MATPRSTFQSGEFAVILDYDYETPPMGEVSVKAYGRAASQLRLSRIEMKSNLSSYFQVAMPDLEETIYTGQTRGGTYRVVMDMASYIACRMENGLHVQELRRSFNLSFPKLWLSVRRAMRRMSDKEPAKPEIRILPSAAVDQQQIDSLYGYPVKVKRKAEALA